jgi:glycosyltransferase involved in cell wall biosynthesis
VQLHLRGTATPAVRAELAALAEAYGVADALHVHPQVPPDELLSRTAEHDIGLALEQGRDENNAIASSNKLFFYLLAGLAVAATDVPGQRAVLGAGGAGWALYPPGDARALADVFRRWQHEPALLADASEAALTAARERWNWEAERAALVDTVARVLGVPARAPLPLSVAAA